MSGNPHYFPPIQFPNRQMLQNPRVTLTMPPSAIVHPHSVNRVPYNMNPNIVMVPAGTVNPSAAGGMVPIPLTKSSVVGAPAQIGENPDEEAWIPYYMNPFNANPGKAGELLYKQFEGFRDFTMASAKSGLNVGERVAFYIYEKFSKWSRKWFTHFFLFIVIFFYSLAGAFIFVAVEGPPQQKALLDIRQIKTNFTTRLFSLAHNTKFTNDIIEWEGAVDKEMQPFIQSLTTIFKSGYFDIDPKEKPTWGFWNAMFYCGTVYTTIDLSMEELRRCLEEDYKRHIYHFRDNDRFCLSTSLSISKKKFQNISS